MVNLESSILSCFRAGILVIDQDGVVIYFNTIGAKILEGSGLKLGDNVHARAGENSFFRVLSESISMHYLPSRVEVEVPGGDGDRLFIGFTLSELQEDEKRVGICAFFKDLTHVEMTEENANLKQRLLLLGQMAAGLAHEIRNPMASIGVHCSILKTHLSKNEKLFASVEMMAREIEKVEHIIRECLNFVRPAELGIKMVPVDKVVEGVVRRFQSLTPAMEFSVRAVAGTNLQAEADAALLEQMFNNIIANAVDACDGKGKVEISLGISRHFSESMPFNNKAASILDGHTGEEEEFIRITVRDNGPGIAPEIREKIFVPFFTTKKSGTGLGLAMAQKIVHAHGGVLDLKSEPNKGTDFIIKIPARQRSG